MKKAILLTAMLILAVFQANAARDWSVNTTQYAYHAVVYAVLQDAGGNAVTLGDDDNLGAFIGDECRAIATSTTFDSGQTLFTIRIGVAAEDKGKEVKFVVRSGSTQTEFTLAETIEVSGGDETVGSINPSSPKVLTYTPITSITLPEKIELNMDETLDLTTVITCEPANATMPDAFEWDFADVQDYINVENNILSAISPNPYGCYIGLIAGSGRAYTCVFVHQPITSLEINPDYPDYPDATIEVEVNDYYDLNAKLAEIVIISPDNATEKVAWKPSDAEAIVWQEQITDSGIGDGYWNPVKPGTYTMTGSAAYGGSVTVTVKVIQPVESLGQQYRDIVVIKGEEITQYLKHTVKIFPENATTQTEGLTYTISESENYDTPTLKFNEDGTITAKTACHSVTVYVSHQNIPNTQIPVVVKVVPNDSVFIKAKENPMLKEMLSSEFGQTNLYSTLLNNCDSSDLYAEAQKSEEFLSWYNNKFSISMKEVQDEGKDNLLTIDADNSAATVNAYGSTNVRLYMPFTASGFDDAGTFVPDKAYEYGVTYKLIISQGLESISLQTVELGMEDTGVRLVATTVPEGYILNEYDAKLSFSNQVELATFERVAGTNEWIITPQRVGEGMVNLTYQNYGCNTQLNVSQHLNKEAGWHWVSLYGGGVDVSKYFDNAQELRSQSALVYNDPEYGFFGDLQRLEVRNCYKIQVKDGQTVDFIIPECNSYRDDSTHVILSTYWNWMANPYCKNHSFDDVSRYIELPDNAVILSKSDGMATYAEGTWSSTIKTWKAGEGYLVYLPEGSMDVLFVSEDMLVYNEKYSTMTSDNTNVKHAAARNNKVWNYDSRRFADNMAIIAKGTAELEEGRHTIGAFVGDECRGEGSVVNGRILMTVNGKANENITFKLYDTQTGAITDLTDEIPFGDIAGSFTKPVILHTVVSGIENVGSDNSVNISVSGNNICVDGAENGSVEVYNLSGQRVSLTGLAADVYVVKARTSQGTVTKKVVVK
jgi:hypothetical protein